MYHSVTVGKDVEIAKFAVHRYETNLLPKPATGFTPQFGPALYEALHKVIQPREGIPNSGDIGAATWDVLWEYLDAYRKAQYLAWSVPVIPKPNPVPDLGPLYYGGASVLNHQLTHNTDGIPYYPAYDDGWIGGRTVLAVEDMIVREASSSNPGDAFYGAGKSKIDYWYGHLIVAPSVGRQFRKGEAVGRIYYQGSKSHVHLGVNARNLIGHDLLYGAHGNGPDYSYGSATVGTQLKEYLSL
jgi:hypothetical protein